jgi:hypothetical protein
MLMIRSQVNLLIKGEIMFTLDTTIDTVQTGKKTFVNTFVTNETVKAALINFVDAQTAYTKEAVKAGTDAFTTVAKETVTAVQNASKFDYTKFGEGVMKAYTATTKK